VLQGGGCAYYRAVAGSVPGGRRGGLHRAPVPTLSLASHPAADPDWLEAARQDVGQPIRQCRIRAPRALVGECRG
jgi:hypothetical protein